MALIRTAGRNSAGRFFVGWRLLARLSMYSSTKAFSRSWTCAWRRGTSSPGRCEVLLRKSGNTSAANSIPFGCSAAGRTACNSRRNESSSSFDWNVARGRASGPPSGQGALRVVGGDFLVLLGGVLRRRPAGKNPISKHRREQNGRPDQTRTKWQRDFTVATDPQKMTPANLGNTNTMYRLPMMNTACQVVSRHHPSGGEGAGHASITRSGSTSSSRVGVRTAV